jgi:hypothetical protein
MAAFLESPAMGAARACVTLIIIGALAQNCAGACDFSRELEPARAAVTGGREFGAWVFDGMPDAPGE